MKELLDLPLGSEPAVYCCLNVSFDVENYTAWYTNVHRNGLFLQLLLGLEFRKDFDSHL